MAAAAVTALVMDAIQNTLSARHGVILGEVAFAERALIDDLIAAGGHRDHAGNLFCVGFLTQRLIDLSLALHVAPPVLIFLSGRSSSRVSRKEKRFVGGIAIS